MKLKIKRMTFTKIVLKTACILFPILLVDYKISDAVKVEGSYLYIFFIILAWEFGKFIYKVLTDNTS